MMVFALHIFWKYIRQSAPSGVDCRIIEAKEKWDGNREEKKQNLPKANLSLIGAQGSCLSRIR